MQLAVDWLSSLPSWSDLSFWHSQIDWLVLAKSSGVRDPNILGQIQEAFDNFIKSGQVWALLTGLAIGYLLKSITA
jgi:hypothetical protein